MKKKLELYSCIFCHFTREVWRKAKRLRKKNHIKPMFCAICGRKTKFIKRDNI